MMEYYGGWPGALHMTVAMINHYRRRGELLPPDLIMIDRVRQTVGVDLGM